MADQVQLTFLFAIVALAYGVVATPITKSFPVASKSRNAILDKEFDTLQPHIRKFMLENDLDPMKIMDFSESLLPHLPGALKGNIDFKNGWMQDMANVKRTKHIVATYEAKRIVLNMDIGWDLIDFNYEYYLKYMLARRHGDINGRFYGVDAHVVMTVDLVNYTARLESLKFNNVRKYNIKFEGRLLDPVLNKVAKVVTVIFRKQVLSRVERYALMIMRDKIDELNTSFPRPNRMKLIRDWLNISNVQFE